MCFMQDVKSKTLWQTEWTGLTFVLLIEADLPLQGIHAAHRFNLRQQVRFSAVPVNLHCFPEPIRPFHFITQNPTIHQDITAHHSVSDRTGCVCMCPSSRAPP